MFEAAVPDGIQRRARRTASLPRARRASRGASSSHGAHGAASPCTRAARRPGSIRSHREGEERRRQNGADPRTAAACRRARGSRPLRARRSAARAPCRRSGRSPGASRTICGMHRADPLGLPPARARAPRRQSGAPSRNRRRHSSRQNKWRAPPRSAKSGARPIDRHAADRIHRLAARPDVAIMTHGLQSCSEWEAAEPCGAPTPQRRRRKKWPATGKSP